MAHNDISPRRTFVLLLAMTLATILIRWLLGRGIRTPGIFIDEWLYVMMARVLPLGHGPLYFGIQTHVPCWAYPMMIGPLINSAPMSDAYEHVRLLNALMMTATAWPAYGLAREVTSRRRALIAAGLTLLHPGGMLYTRIMTENLFFPVVTLGLWLIYRAIAWPDWRRSLMAGVVLGLGFHIKPHGLLLPAMAAATVALFETIECLQATRSLAARKRLAIWRTAVGKGLLRQWPMALGWLGVFGLRLAELVWFETSEGFRLKYVLGYYGSMASGLHSATGLRLLASVGLTLGAFFWGTGLLPGLALARTVPGVLRGRMDRRQRLMVILAAVANGMMMGMMARFVVIYTPQWQWIERYLFIFYPPVFALFAARELDVQRRGQWGLLCLFALLLTVLVFPLAYAQRWLVASDAPMLCAPALFFLRRTSDSALGLATCAGLGTAGLALIGFARGRLGRQVLAIGLIFAAANLGWAMLARNHVTSSNLAMNAMARKIEKTIGRQGKLVVLTDGTQPNKNLSAVLHATIWNPSMLAYIDPTDHYWFASPLTREADGTLQPPFAPEHAWLLASRNLDFNRPPEQRFGRWDLYHFEGKPLRMKGDGCEALRRRRIDPNRPQAVLDALRLAWLKVEPPQVWRAGEVTEVGLQIRNDSAFTFPGGQAKVYLGYHWANPERSGGRWDAVVWDDGRQVLIPPGVRPGTTVTLTMKINVPHEASEAWMLTLAPLLVTDDGPHWDRAGRNALVQKVKVQNSSEKERRLSSRNLNAIDFLWRPDRLESPRDSN